MEYIERAKIQFDSLNIASVFSSCDLSRKFSEIVKNHTHLRLGVGYVNLVSQYLDNNGLRADFDSFMSRYFGMSDYKYRTSCLECLAYVFDLECCGIVWKENAVNQKIDSITFDKNGLAEANDRIRFGKEGADINGYRIFYDPHLYRYNLTNSSGFLEQLIRVAYSTNPFPKVFGIRLSTDLLVQKDFVMNTRTAAFIRGPKGISEEQLCSNQFPEIPNGTVTQHLRINDPPFGSLQDLLRLDVMWSFRDGIKTFQVEELLSYQEHIDQYTCRYAHSQWDVATKQIIHFDGAIRQYNQRNYEQRLRTDIKSAGKDSNYLKLFRIDHPIDLPAWSSLVVKYFNGNELIMEYFGGESE